MSLTKRYLEKLEEEQKVWCKTHPTGFIGKDTWGNWYPICWTGKKLEMQGEEAGCDIQLEGGDEPK